MPAMRLHAPSTSPKPRIPRRQQKYEQPVLDASAKLLRVVPEIYTIWNFRREALSPILAAGGEAAVKAAEGELALTQACLTENPKSYSTWHHRKWVVAHGLGSLVRELALVSKARFREIVLYANFLCNSILNTLCGVALVAHSCIRC